MSASLDRKQESEEREHAGGPATQAVLRTAALTVAALVAFAGNSILCRAALADGAIDPVTFTVLRLVSGAVALLPFLRGRSRRWSLGAAAALSVYAFCFSLAYVRLQAGTGALLLFGLVQVTMIAVGLRQGERPSPLRALGMLAAAGGVVWLVAPGVAAPDGGGAFLMGTAGVAWAAYTLLGRRAGTRPAVATAANFVLAAVLALAVLLVRAHALEVSTRGVALAVSSGAVTSGLGYVVWYAALRGHSATSAAVVQLAVPVLAALGGVVLLGEQPTLRLVLAGLLTLGGVAVAVLARTGSAAPR